MTARTTGPEQGRRGAIDLARISALGAVVAGHLLLAVVDRGPNGPRGANLIELRPAWGWVASLAPMPVFFAAGGWANAGSPFDRGRPRLASLVGVAAAAVTCWGLAVVVSGGDRTLSSGARLATQPLWFLGAYVPLAALGQPIARAIGRRGPALLAVPVLAVAATDAAHYALGAPQAWRWVNFFLVWGFAWGLGAWWRQSWSATPGETRARRERTTGAALLIGGTIVAAALVGWAGYSPALIDALPGRRSNTTPPGLLTVAACCGQVGALMVVAAAGDRLAARWERLLGRVGEIAVGVYVWHLTGLALCAATLSLWASPERLTPAWWATRPLWWAGVLAVTGALVFATSWVRSRRAGAPNVHLADGSIRAGGGGGWTGPLGVILGSAAGILVGLKGPRNPELAAVLIGLFLASWWCLARGERRPVRSAPADGPTAA